MSESFVQANCVDNSAYTSSSGGNRGKTARFWPHSPGKTRRITILFQFPVPLLLTPLTRLPVPMIVGPLTRNAYPDVAARRALHACRISLLSRVPARDAPSTRGVVIP